MLTYPFSSPIILTDNIFVQYGGQTGTFTSAQRQAAYLTAEMQATQYIGTFLLPTIVTGTYGYAGRFVTTDYGYVHRIIAVTILSKDSATACTLQEDSSCAFIWDDTFGYLDARCLSAGACNCNNILVPYQYRIAYEAGLPTGTANQPTVLLGLTMAAQIVLNEMAYPSANESTGDIGVTEFSSQQYSEKRNKLKHTAFGNSAKANYIAHLFDNTIKKARRTLVL